MATAYIKSIKCFNSQTETVNYKNAKIARSQILVFQVSNYRLLGALSLIEDCLVGMLSAELFNSTEQTLYVLSASFYFKMPNVFMVDHLYGYTVLLLFQFFYYKCLHQQSFHLNKFGNLKYIYGRIQYNSQFLIYFCNITN